MSLEQSEVEEEWYEISEVGGPEDTGLVSYRKNFDFHLERDRQLLEVLEQSVLI